MIHDVWWWKSIDQPSSNGTINKQRRWIAPLFNSEQLLSKSIPELEGSGINLCVQLSVEHVSLD
jgi:hypothetical protein